MWSRIINPINKSRDTFAQPDGFDRVSAFLLDWLFITLFGILLIGGAVIFFDPQDILFQGIYIFISIGLPAIYFCVCWKVWSSSIGKRLRGLRVVDRETFSEISWWQAYVRLIGYMVWPVMVIGLIIWPDRVPLHDKIARTTVVYSGDNK